MHVVDWHIDPWMDSKKNPKADCLISRIFTQKTLRYWYKIGLFNKNMNVNYKNRSFHRRLRPEFKFVDTLLLIKEKEKSQQAKFPLKVFLAQNPKSTVKLL